MDCKALLALAVAVAAAILACAPHDVSAQPGIGSVSLINGGIMEGIKIKQCLGPEGSHILGQGYIPLPGFKYFEFPLNSLSQGWRCDFEYRNAVTSILHTANVLVWQGILRADATPESSSSLISIDTNPCIDCVWKIQVDGFYRADAKNRDIYTRLAGWTPA